MRSSQQLEPGWALFTHVVSHGSAAGNFDKAGPLRKLVAGSDGEMRQALGPSSWEPGHVYVDQLELEVPKNTDSPQVGVMVGVWHDMLPISREDQPAKDVTPPSFRLPVISLLPVLAATV